ncbi:hypothetical protein RRG08_038449 [Elysia crispata]|uniref:Uncharacterized protein n=1 Tax=Elysia crispata TaxID=231223 RepID=A0AAE1AM14_9GAST|nr:hypothetical protein RRG08_038449 [Elysia crispata]
MKVFNHYSIACCTDLYIAARWTRHRNRILGSCIVTSPTSYSAALKRDVFTSTISNLRHLLSVLVSQHLQPYSTDRWRLELLAA